MNATNTLKKLGIEKTFEYIQIISDTFLSSEASKYFGLDLYHPKITFCLVVIKRDIEVMDKNMPKIMDWADKFADGEFPTQREMIREAITNPEHPYYNFILHLPATFTAQDAGQQNTVAN